MAPSKVHTNSSISSAFVNAEFESTLLEFDLKPEWFKKIPVKRRGDDSLRYIYKVRVPKDLPVPVILNELNQRIKDQPLRMASREIKSNKQSNLRLFFGNEIMHEADFITDTSISRNKPLYGFMINDVDQLSDNELADLLAYPEKFSFMLIPSEKAESLKKKIIESGREYVVMLNEDIPDVKYRLDESYNKGRLNGSVGNIIKSFGDSKLFLLADFSNHQLSAQVENLFKIRKIKLTPLSRYDRVAEKDYLTLAQDLNNHIKRSQGSDIFIISSKDFMQLYNEFRNLRKRGYKFIIPSAINYGI